MGDLHARGVEGERPCPAEGFQDAVLGRAGDDLAELLGAVATWSTKWGGSSYGVDPRRVAWRLAVRRREDREEHVVEVGEGLDVAPASALAQPGFAQVVTRPGATAFWPGLDF
ncbi:MAG: hypothetical protein ACRDRW_02635 [Pseudonocardiaceae bacterium]